MTIKAEPYTHDPLYSATTDGRTYTEEEPRAYEKIYKNTTGKPKADTLLPCPFCGGKPHINTNTGWGNAAVIECRGCGAEFECFEPTTERSVKLATEKWNRRVNG